MTTNDGKKGNSTATTIPSPAEAADLLSALEADRYAKEMDETLLYLDELDPDNCPPDMIYQLGEREAWIYEHGNIAELVFVRV